MLHKCLAKESPVFYGLLVFWQYRQMLPLQETDTLDFTQGKGSNDKIGWGGLLSLGTKKRGLFLCASGDIVTLLK